MSQKVNAIRIAQFRRDRKLLPYDDIVVAKNMRVDRSNYSKATNEGPITNTFLDKFYTAFGDELKDLKETVLPVEKEEVVKQLKGLEHQVDLLLQGVDNRLAQFEQNIEKLLAANLSKLERLITMLAPRKQD